MFPAVNLTTKIIHLHADARVLTKDGYMPISMCTSRVRAWTGKSWEFISNSTQPSRMPMAEAFFSSGHKLYVDELFPTDALAAPFTLTTAPTVLRLLNAKGSGEHIGASIRNGLDVSSKDIPIGYKISNKIAWLSAFIGEAATVKREGDGAQYLSVSSTSIEFLFTLKLMLQEMAVDSAVEVEAMEYEKPTMFHLTINSKSALQLARLGFEFGKVSLNFRIPSTYAYPAEWVLFVGKPAEVDDVYSVVVQTKHTLVVDGMLLPY